MKNRFDGNDLLYWNLMLVLCTMFNDGIIDKADLAKAEKYLSKKYNISKGSLVRVYFVQSILNDDVPK